MTEALVIIGWAVAIVAITVALDWRAERRRRRREMLAEFEYLKTHTRSGTPLRPLPEPTSIPSGGRPLD